MKKIGLDNQIQPYFPKLQPPLFVIDRAMDNGHLQEADPIFCLIFPQMCGNFLKKVLIFRFCCAIMDKRMSEITEQEV